LSSKSSKSSSASNSKSTPGVDEDFIDFIKRFLEPDSSRRIGSREGDIEEIKKHPFFNGIDWKVLDRKGYEPFFSVEIDDYKLIGCPQLDVLYTTNFMAGQNDGYGDTFVNYDTTFFI